MSCHSSESQIRWACLQLISGREISHACEIEEVRGWRLASIIHTLRCKHGWPITTRYDSNRVAHYRLAEGVDTGKLQKPKSFYPKKKDVRAPFCKQADINNPNSEDNSK